MMPGQSEKSRRAEGGLSVERELAATLITCSMLPISADVTKQPNMASTEDATYRDNTTELHREAKR